MRNRKRRHTATRAPPPPEPIERFAKSLEINFTATALRVDQLSGSEFRRAHRQANPFAADRFERGGGVAKRNDPLLPIRLHRESRQWRGKPSADAFRPGECG